MAEMSGEDKGSELEGRPRRIELMGVDGRIELGTSGLKAVQRPLSKASMTSEQRLYL